MYGFSITNNNNQIIIDTKYKIFQLFDKVTISGVYDSIYKIYKYSGSPSDFKLFDIPVGKFVGRTHDGGLISDMPTLTIRKLRLSSNIPIVNQYGIQLFNESGECTYQSGAEVEYVTDKYSPSGTSAYYSSGSTIPDFPYNVSYYEKAINPLNTYFGINMYHFITAGFKYQSPVVYRKSLGYIHMVYVPYATSSTFNINPEPSQIIAGQ